ncbi:MAG TPA: FtsX-like permease family protein, partial [Acidimicrobiales bacterium]|nr:FtsX-like permease family protein [Acidimicrobiales bacterium]
RDADLFMIGVEATSQLGWPRADGRLPTVPRRGEILVDRVFAENYGIEAGDVLRTGTARVRVRDVVSGGNAVAYQFGWANLADVDRLTGSPGFVSYFLVRTDEARAPAVARRIESRVAGTKVFTTTELADRNAENLSEGFLPMLWVLVLVAFVVGTAMIGLIIYTATVERRREYGVLKAIGFSNRRLYKVVYQQSLIATATGYVLGCVLSFVVADGVERVVPVFVTAINSGDLVFAASGAFLMSVVASFIPARPVARLDPAEVFRT